LDKFVTIGDDRFYVLSKVLVENCRYTMEDLKLMWGLADTILRNHEHYYICMKLIEVEFQEL
jgi:hypothetical protein